MSIAFEYSKAHILNITNHFKKATINVVKTDKYSKDKKAHGDATLDGAQFALYADKDCKNKATVFDANGKAKTADVYTVKDGKVETDYLRSGTTYYLKEVKAPAGYLLSDEVVPVTVDASAKTVEFTKALSQKEFGNQPVLGKIAIRKDTLDTKTGETAPEAGAKFQVYLTSKGSFDKCDEYERAEITTDSTGYGETGNLYYGKYTVHQVDCGDVDTYLAEDFEAEVTENGKTYTFPVHNILFKAYLKIVKKDGNTEKQVLKAGTAYQIYKVTGEKEELVTQTYENGNKKETVDRFVTDETGEIMTVDELKSGTYRIYEVEAPSGYHIKEKYIEVTMNSKAANYESYTDAEGNRHAVITLTYTNEETYGKLKLYKSGEVLTGFADGKFVYEERLLKGAVFEVYAAEDIVTQDNQKTNWYDKGELVTTITTGEGAKFEKECKGITASEVDEAGMVTVNLPLGKYQVIEKQTLYGYVLPDKAWDVEFNWKNKDEEFVLNATDVTDEDGVLRVKNERAKVLVSLLKTDAADKKAIEGAVFGIYTKHDIYNSDGEKIVDAGTQVGTMTTDQDGKAVSEADLPLMSEGFDRSKLPAEPQASGTPAPSAAPEATNTPDAGTGNGTLNSGDYYLKEISVSDSYYLDETEHPVHLEYQDAETAVIAANIEAVNTRTTTTISKRSVTGSKELKGCKLEIMDQDKNVIVRWTSGDKTSVKFSKNLDSLGYRNLTASFDKGGSVVIGGLFHDAKYILKETRPADGYATADDIAFELIEKEKGETAVAVYQGKEMVMQDGNRVIMVDDTTKIRLIKISSDTGQGLSGAKFVVLDSKGNKVLSFTSTEDGVDITGKLAAGKTYTFKEIEAPKGYKLAKPVKYKVKDTGKLQKVSVTDKKNPKPHVPQTGGMTPFAASALVLFVLCGGIVLFFYRRRVRR